MRKIFYFCLINLFAVSFATAKVIFTPRDISFYKDMSQDGIYFYKNLERCSPAVYDATNEKVYGITKDGKCHYSYKQLYNGSYVENHCILPMAVVLGYGSTALDVVDYSYTDVKMATDIIQQNNEIRKILLDYCKIISKEYNKVKAKEKTR